MAARTLSIRYLHSEVSGILQRLEAYCVELELNDTLSFQARVVVAEVLNNIIQHSPEPSREHRFIRVHFHFSDQQLTITMTYWSPRFPPPSEINYPESTALSGRGWPIIRDYIDEIHYHHFRGINSLILKKHYGLS